MEQTSNQSAPCILNPVTIFEGVLTLVATLAWTSVFDNVSKTIIPDAPKLVQSILNAIMVTIIVLLVILFMHIRAKRIKGSERYTGSLWALT